MLVMCRPHSAVTDSLRGPTLTLILVTTVNSTIQTFGAENICISGVRCWCRYFHVLFHNVYITLRLKNVGYVRMCAEEYTCTALWRKLRNGWFIFYILLHGDTNRAQCLHLPGFPDIVFCSFGRIPHVGTSVETGKLHRAEPKYTSMTGQEFESTMPLRLIEKIRILQPKNLEFLQSYSGPKIFFHML